MFLQIFCFCLALPLIGNTLAAVAVCDEQFEFTCVDQSGCTSLLYRCDGDNDCVDGSDESPDVCKENCAGYADRFQCADGTCLRERNVEICNGSPECPDGSDEDEKRCSDCNGDASLWKCRGSTNCIDKNDICNGEVDCGEDDHSDEDSITCAKNCGGIEGRFQCANKKCVRAAKACNGRDDCGDNSDENTDVCAHCNGDISKMKCGKSTKCFRVRDRCDGYKDCVIWNEEGDQETDDITDEENCHRK